MITGRGVQMRSLCAPRRPDLPMSELCHATGEEAILGQSLIEGALYGKLTPCIISGASS
jgi:hypothetical protein